MFPVSLPSFHEESRSLRKLPYPSRKNQGRGTEREETALTGHVQPSTKGVVSTPSSTMAAFFTGYSKFSLKGAQAATSSSPKAFMNLGAGLEGDFSKMSLTSPKNAQPEMHSERNGPQTSSRMRSVKNKESSRILLGQNIDAVRNVGDLKSSSGYLNVGIRFILGQEHEVS